MFENILNLEGVSLLNKEQQKNVLGGSRRVVTVCKATCKDGSVVDVSACSDANLGCSSAGGSTGCSCDHPGPFDKPKELSIN